MIAPAADQQLITYLWPYLLARMLYDDFVRPLARGRATAVLLACACVAIAAFLWKRRTRRRP
jgi:hypothetical protein